ncbi:MAG: short-subunit dehydrogenase [Vicingaceae bacterium]|jgi:short-subunit dehydrogenase
MMNIIVSGASKGIGYELAYQAAESGHNVLAVARNGELLDRLVAKSELITALKVDLVNDDCSESVLAWSNKVGNVDVLINNAGQLINKPFIETSAEDFKNQFDANIITAVKLTQVVIPVMKKAAHIVNITSMGGFQGSSKYAGLSAYSSSKGALSILTECLAEELKDSNISVNALALGAVQTEMLENAFPGYDAPVSALEMASYILDFASTGHRFYNGQILPVAIGNP